MPETEISIIIPSYKRQKQVNNILENLIKFKPNNLTLEIIICDSFSNYNLDKFLKNKFEKVSIKYFNIKKNILAAKRNYGINKSSFNKIILLDDDCIPDDKVKDCINSSRLFVFLWIFTSSRDTLP